VAAARRADGLCSRDGKTPVPADYFSYRSEPVAQHMHPDVPVLYGPGRRAVAVARVQGLDVRAGCAVSRFRAGPWAVEAPLRFHMRENLLLMTFSDRPISELIS
jgi:hypothetical protein